MLEGGRLIATDIIIAALKLAIFVESIDDCISDRGLLELALSPHLFDNILASHS